MSRTVAENATWPWLADSRTFDRIGIVLRRSTTLCTCPRAFSSVARSIVSFIQVRSVTAAAAFPPRGVWVMGRGRLDETARGGRAQDALTPLYRQTRRSRPRRG